MWPCANTTRQRWNLRRWWPRAPITCARRSGDRASYGVPILRRPALAREIYATVDLGRAIPEALFVAVAEILALVLRLRRNR
jgi:type III secretion system FlhB-like substrate exporter